MWSDSVGRRLRAPASGTKPMSDPLSIPIEILPPDLTLIVLEATLPLRDILDCWENHIDRLNEMKPALLGEREDSISAFNRIFEAGGSDESVVVHCHIPHVGGGIAQ